MTFIKKYWPIATLSCCLAMPGLADESMSEKTAETASSVTSSLSAQSMSNILAAEFNYYRGNFQQALKYYLIELEQAPSKSIYANAVKVAIDAQAFETMQSLAEQWIALDQENPEAISYLAIAQAYNMQASQALNTMIQALELGGDTQFKELVTILPDQHPSEGLYLQTLTSIEARFDDSMDITQALSLLYLRQGNKTKVAEYTDKSVAMADKVGDVVYSATYMYESSDNYAKAAAMYRKALAEDPENLRLRQRFAQFALEHDLGEALEQFQILLTMMPNDSHIIFTIGLIHLEMSQLGEAQAKFQQLVQLQERTSSAHYYLGYIAHIKKDFPLAITHYNQVSGHKEQRLAGEQIIYIHLEQGNYERAHQLADSLIKRYGTDRDIFEQLQSLKAHIYQQQGDFEQAYKLLSDTLENNPDSFQVRYNRAMLYETHDKLEQMETDLRYIIERNPDNATALNALGYTLADKTDRYHEALTLIEKALELDPNDPAVLDSMGWVLFKLGRHEDALKYLEHALSLLPNAEVAAHLGEVLWVLGKKEAAQAVFQEALSISPEHTILNETIKRLNIPH